MSNSYRVSRVVSSLFPKRQQLVAPKTVLASSLPRANKAPSSRFFVNLLPSETRLASSQFLARVHFCSDFWLLSKSYHPPND
jgi:hypothetical protein